MGTIDVDLLRVGKGTGIISHLPFRSGDDPVRRGVAIDLLTEAVCHGRGGHKETTPPSVAGGEDTGHGIRVPAPLSALPRSLRRYQPDQVPRVFSQSRRFVRDAPGGSWFG